jgi:hypothetical protein
VREGPSPRFGSSPPPLLGQSGMKKLGVGKGYSGVLNRVFFDRIFLPFPANYKLGIRPIV